MVCGSLVNLFNFIQPLRSRSLPSPRPVVFLSARPPPDHEWERVSHFSQVCNGLLRCVVGGELLLRLGLLLL